MRALKLSREFVLRDARLGDRPVGRTSALRERRSVRENGEMFRRKSRENNCERGGAGETGTQAAPQDADRFWRTGEQAPENGPSERVRENRPGESRRSAYRVIAASSFADRSARKSPDATACRASLPSRRRTVRRSWLLRGRDASVFERFCVGNLVELAVRLSRST